MMSGQEAQPFRVLDLACGAGLLRVAVARRVPSREIHYTGIDSNRFAMHGVEFIARPGAQAILAGGRPTSTIPEFAPRGDPHPLGGRLKERFILAELDLQDPERLAIQLATLLGDERFDEVHLHLPTPFRHARPPAGPHVLRVLAAYLRPGGRLYHLFQSSSPLFDFEPERIWARPGLACPPAEMRADVLGRNERRFREGASTGGLRVDKYGHRWDKGRRNGEVGETGEVHKKGEWITLRSAAAERDRRTAETYARLVEQYSRFSEYARHFLILRKEKAAAEE